MANLLSIKASEQRALLDLWPACAQASANLALLNKTAPDPEA